MFCSIQAQFKSKKIVIITIYNHISQEKIIKLHKKPHFFISDFQALLNTGAQRSKISLTRDQAEMITLHASELYKWNRKINLTAITDTRAIVDKHFIDSLAVSPFLLPGKRLIDLGTGGGFPAIPLKIMDPSMKITMVDAALKKVNFLKHVIRTLNLKETEALHDRVEDLCDTALYKNKFDYVISRGFANLEKFCALALPFLSNTGQIISLKGKNAENEITEELKDHFKIKTDTYILPFEKSKRFVITLSCK